MCSFAQWDTFCKKKLLFSFLSSSSQSRESFFFSTPLFSQDTNLARVSGIRCSTRDSSIKSCHLFVPGTVAAGVEGIIKVLFVSSRLQGKLECDGFQDCIRGMEGRIDWWFYCMVGLFECARLKAVKCKAVRAKYNVFERVVSCLGSWNKYLNLININ